MSQFLKVWLIKRDLLSSPLWGADGGGGVCAKPSSAIAHTPTLTLPTRGREKEPRAFMNQPLTMRAER
jgi:hypothetical protein